MSKPITIMGIDPGIGTTGIGIIRATAAQPTYIHCLDIKPGVFLPGVSKTEYSIRCLVQISDEIHRAIKIFRPSLIVAETYIFFESRMSQVQSGESKQIVRSGPGGSQAVNAGRLLGIIQEISIGSGITYRELTTQRIKSLVVGRSGGRVHRVSKGVVRRATKLYLGIDVKNDHRADALAAALAGQSFVRWDRDGSWSISNANGGKEHGSVESTSAGNPELQANPSAGNHP